MANGIEDPTHIEIIEWVIGTIIVIGGVMLSVLTKIVKGKKNIKECDLIHIAIDEKLDNIKQDLIEGKREFTDTRIRIEDMDRTLVEISTILKERSKDETLRYDRHTEEWKDK